MRLLACHKNLKGELAILRLYKSSLPKFSVNHIQKVRSMRKIHEWFGIVRIITANIFAKLFY
jgi:hypothetical protein